MIVFPIIYLSTIIYTLKEFFRGNKNAFLIFLIFGLSIYTTTMSVVFKLGFKESIVFLQPLKELFTLVILVWCVLEYKSKIKFHYIDYAISFYFCYIFLYALLPIGEHNLFEKLLAFKSSCFFICIYFVGRFYNLKTINLKKFFLFILILAFAAAIVVLIEVLLNNHLQLKTGYAEYIYYFFNLEPTGNYGLSWTFETGSGTKRFASFFANPLEHAASTIISLSILVAYYTNDDYQFKLDKFGLGALMATFISILFALSRSSFVSYFFLIYVYGFLTKKKYIPKVIHICAVITVSYFVFLIVKDFNKNDTIFEWILQTINFSDSSSIGHVVEWAAGISSILEHPLGLGLGTSGTVASSLGENVGGENQFIIIGVQVGILAVIAYMFIYISILRNAIYWFYRLRGKEKMICLSILLIKVGFIIPMLTSEIESSSYISYMIWLLTGMFVNVISNKIKTAKFEVSAINSRS